MASIPNELTGPRVYVAVDDKKTAKMHLTGGYRQSKRKKAFCGNPVSGKTLVDARDIAPHSEHQNSNVWCIGCLNLLELEALDQKILFSAITISKGSYGDLVVIPHLQRPSKLKTHPFRLTNAPPRKDWRIMK
tara:strand:+ start:337 stop:735 length:399 start_codon:yes stop_codon:yes gene_type:complete